MIYMIVERFHPGKVRSVYERVGEKGRMMPDGVSYINSWIAEDLSICYQVIESSSEEKILEWTRHWDDLCDFEIVRVISSAEAKLKAFVENK